MVCDGRHKNGIIYIFVTMDVFNKLKSASNMTRSFKEREVVFIKVQKICIYNQSKGIVFSLKKKKKNPEVLSMLQR